MLRRTYRFYFLTICPIYHFLKIEICLLYDIVINNGTHIIYMVCVNKVMRLILYKIIYAIIRLNQHCSLRNNIPLMQHTWPSEFSTPHSGIGSQILLGS
jgi:hypothetical protein